MKLFLALTMVTISNLVCASNEFTPTCQKEFDRICGKKTPTEKSECMQNAINNLSAECRTSLEAKKSPGTPCDNDLKTVCKDKPDDQIPACLAKSGTAACKESVKKMTINVCPAAPDECKLEDYSKDADKAEDCYANYFDNLSPECKKLSGIR